MVRQGNTRWGPGPVNTNWRPGPGPGAEQRAGGWEAQTPFCKSFSSAMFVLHFLKSLFTVVVLGLYL